MPRDLLPDQSDALRAFALDKWGTTNPILVPDDERALQQAYYKAVNVASEDACRATLTEWLAASDALKAVDTSSGQAIRAALDRVDAAKVAARALTGGRHAGSRTYDEERRDG